MTFDVTVKFAHGIQFYFRDLPETEMISIKHWMKSTGTSVLILHNKGVDYYLNREFFCAGYIEVSK